MLFLVRNSFLGSAVHDCCPLLLYLDNLLLEKVWEPIIRPMNKRLWP